MNSIDCAGGDLRISNCRLNATLVVMNVRVLTITKSVYWTPPTSDRPALLVRGTVSIGMDRTQIDEAAVGENLNPAGVPFDGVSDTTMDTLYPSSISGVIYVDGDVDLGNYLALSGSLVCTGPMRVGSGTYTLTRDGDMPCPIGFETYTFAPKPGGFSRAVQ